MAPAKFGLFKGRSKECEPSENLLHNTCNDLMGTPSSPIPSTSKGFCDDYSGFSEFSMMHIDSDDEDFSENESQSRLSSVCKIEEAQIHYKPLPSTNATSTTTLQDSQFDLSHDNRSDVSHDNRSDVSHDNRSDVSHDNRSDVSHSVHDELYYDIRSDLSDDATSIDANSLQFDATSIVSEDVKYCGATKKQRKNKAKEELQAQEHQKDLDMWQASNHEVLQHLLSRSGSLDEQIKWEAIATARGLCTLTAACACRDCAPGRSPACLADGDAGLGAAPLLGAVTVGCSLQ